MRADAFVAPVEQILADPRYFPVQVDFSRGCITFVETTRDRLAGAPFLDGRTDFAAGIRLEVPLAEASAAQWAPMREPSRLIFHVAFCGSTLLATLLDMPGRCFAEREPNVLVDLANAARAQPAALVRSTLELMRALLGRSWRAGEKTVCKPSNWANNLIPLLTATPETICPLFLVTSQREYLYAVLRGGRERIAYAVRAADHLIKHDHACATLWQRALAGTTDPIESAARLSLVGLHVQLQLFEAAMRQGGWGADRLLTLSEIEDDPAEACIDASRALGLDLPHQALIAGVSHGIRRHAKDPQYAYVPELRRAENRQVESAYGRLIERVLDWAALVGLSDDRDLLRRQDDRRLRRA